MANPTGKKARRSGGTIASIKRNIRRGGSRRKSRYNVRGGKPKLIE